MFKHHLAPCPCCSRYTPYVVVTPQHAGLQNGGKQGWETTSVNYPLLTCIPLQERRVVVS